MFLQAYRQAAILAALEIEVNTHGLVSVARRFGMSQASIKAIMAKTKPVTEDLSTKLGLFWRVRINHASGTALAIINKYDGTIKLLN